MPDLIATWVDDQLPTGKPSITQVNPAFYLSRLDKSRTGLSGWG